MNEDFVKAQVKVTHQMIDERDEKIATLRAQRDELLAALEPYASIAQNSGVGLAESIANVSRQVWVYDRDLFVAAETVRKVKG